MGSLTYEKVLRHAEWPYPGKPCWVFTRRPLPLAAPDVTLTAGPPEKVVEEIAGRKALVKCKVYAGETKTAEARVTGVRVAADKSIGASHSS